MQKHLDTHPELEKELNISLLDRADNVLQELLTLARKHAGYNMLIQFALSRKTQSLIDEASTCVTHAIEKLQLELSVTSLGVTLRIDENVSLLMR